MSIRHNLEDHQLDRAVKVLEHELSRNTISKRQRLIYRLYMWSFVVLFVGAVSLYFLQPPDDDQNMPVQVSELQELMSNVATTVFGLGFLASIILFLMNIGLVRKLWRIARARRHLGVTKAFEAAFESRRRDRRITNFITAIMVCLGIAYLLLPIMFLASGLPYGLILVSAPIFLLFGFALFSLHFLRRGVERFDIVQDLRNALHSKSTQGLDDQSDGTQIDEQTYDMLAKLERSQIMEQRQKSIERARSEPDTFGYALQMSFEAQNSKDQLPAHERQLVDHRILDVLTNPEACLGESSKDPDGDYWKLAVEGTSAEIYFRVDSLTNRVQIARIAKTGLRPPDIDTRG